MSLTAKQLQHIEARLHEERSRLVGQLREFTGAESVEDGEAQADGVAAIPTHDPEEGVDTATEQLEASIDARRSAEIAEIDAALERITVAPETFGVDENTGEKIPFARLDIIPWARTTV